MSILNNLINGISLGSVYAIIALGYTMVYGIAKMLNFAHGDVIMVGAYICFFTMSGLSGSFEEGSLAGAVVPALAGVLLAMVVCTVLGMVIERLAYKPLRQAPSLAVLITAIGVSYFLQNSALLLWTSNPKSFSSVVGTGSIKLLDGQLTITHVALVTVAACIVIMLGLTWFTGHTRMGKAMRACSEDKAAAQLMGINVNSTISMTLCHRLRPGSHRRCAALLHLPLPHAHHRRPARHQGLYRRRLRRHRLHPWGHAGRHPAGHHRDLCQGLQHQHLRRGGLCRPDRGAAGQALRTAGQVCARESVR